MPVVSQHVFYMSISDRYSTSFTIACVIKINKPSMFQNISIVDPHGDDVNVLHDSSVKQQVRLQYFC